MQLYTQIRNALKTALNWPRKKKCILGIVRIEKMFITFAQR